MTPIIQRVMNRFHGLQRQSIDTPFFFDLHSFAGFGDRLVELWAALAVARLHDPDAKVSMCWEQVERQPIAGRSRVYATELFSLDNAVFVDHPAKGAVIDMRKKFDANAVATACMVPLGHGGTQIILRSYANWGRHSPDSVHAHIRDYGLDPAMDLETVVDAYCAAARSTRPGPLVAERIPKDLDGRVGVHIRLTDKLVKSESNYDMGESTWERIERRGLEAIEERAAQGARFFICGDDLDYRNQLADKLRSKGVDVIVVDAEPHPDHPCIADLVDFFALAQCSHVIQLTKYSVFSVAAALIGGVGLSNFDFEAHRGESENQINLWRTALARGSSEKLETV